MSAPDPDRQRIAGVYDRLIEPLQAGVRRVAFDVVPPLVAIAQLTNPAAAF